MFISIVIATYNAEKTIRRCINSIIPQVSEDVELIIIDGGSTDQTCSIIEDYIRYITYTISEKDEGIYDAWNKGIRVSRGEWILFIGADDILEPDAVIKYKNYLNNNKDLDFVSALVRYVDINGALLSVSGKKWVYNEGKYMMNVTHVASITSHKYLERVKFFDTRYKIVGDYHLLLKGGPEMKAGFVNEIVATMSSGGASFSVKALKEQLRVKLEMCVIPRWLSYIIYFYQLLLFKTYNIRHRIW